MKSFLVIIFPLVVLTASSQNPSLTNDFKKLEWLAGSCWNQTNTKPGRTAHECWMKPEANKLSGYAVTMQGTDTLFTEKTTIIIKDNVFYYVADAPGNKESVYFKFIELTDSGFVCENQEHDFPKKIMYQFEGLKLKAQISGNGKVIDYYFERKGQ
jgi:hypothetical protein